MRVFPSDGPTRDLEACLDGGAPKERTLAGASFSMECRLCEEGRLSECDLVAAAETGRNFGGAGREIKSLILGAALIKSSPPAPVLLPHRKRHHELHFQ